jgi:protease-4
MNDTEKRRPGPIGRLLRFCWRLLDGSRRLVMNLLFLLLVAIALAALFGERLPEVPAGGALVVAPSGALVDQLSYVDPLTGLLGSDQLPAETLLADLVSAIDRAAGDDRIALLVLQLDAMQSAGLSKLQELAQALERFRASGKQVVAVGDSYSQDQYWLAAQADQVFVNPMGAVLLEGFGLYTNYFKEALDKLAINFHVFRVGTYKAAVEPLLRNDMSEASKENNRIWLGTLWRQYREGVGARRGIAPERLDDYINRYDQVLGEHRGDAAAAALAWKLVDGVKSRTDLNQWLVQQVGADDDGLFRGVDFRDYLAASDHLHLPAMGGDRVGVIVASGMILDGEQPPGLVGGDTLATLIRQARDEANVKAVVLRIDSEGGSAFASEIVRQELEALRAAGKPLVVSMGSIAASGGYWIAAGADQVWATPATVTGSIGIFGAFPTIENSLNKLGIHTDGVGTTSLAGALRVDRPLAPAAARAIQSSVEHGYAQFLQVVASGRDMSVEQVDALGQGRIWSGADARERGLVDRLGSLHDAMQAAAELAQLERFEPQLIEPPLTPQQRLLRRLTSSVRAWLPQPQVGTAFARGSQLLPPTLLRDWQLLTRLNDPRATYLLCAVCARL